MWMKEDRPRWSWLFADLESQAEALAGTEDQEAVVERTRIEVGRLGLTDRLRGVEGQLLDVRCAGVGMLRGRLERVGTDWLLLTEPSGTESLVPVAAVTAVTGLARWSAVADAQVDRRLGLRSALRGLVRARVTVRVLLVDGGSIAGTLDRVGLDFLELAEHAADERRRVGSVLRVWTIPLLGVGVVRCAGH
ncbi:MAG: hypothetical protein ACJ768_21500 [Gaiellaceae bacterium]